MPSVEPSRRIVVRPFELDAATRTVRFPYETGGRAYRYHMVLPFALEETARVPRERVALLVDYVGILLATNLLVAFDQRDLFLSGIPVNRDYLTWLEAVLTDLCVDAFAVRGAPYHGIRVHAPARDFTLAPAGGPGFEPRAGAAIAAVGCGKETSVMLEGLRGSHDVTGLNVFYKDAAETALELPLFDAYAARVGPACERFHVSTEDRERIVQDSGRPDFDDHTACASTHLAIGALLAIARGIPDVFFGNERSTVFVNGTHNWFTVSHQWEKSYAYEVAFQRVLERYVTRSVRVSSALRDRWEIEIAREFCGHERYHPVFFSCNHATYLKRWCGRCPKCLQVFIFMDAFLERDAVRAIFGADLLESRELEPCFRGLIGLAPTRPLECVAGVSENLASLHLGRRRNGPAYLLDAYRDTIETGAAWVGAFDLGDETTAAS